MLQFDTIIKYIRRFKYLSLTELIFDRLLLIDRQKKLYPFWRLIVVLKWSFIYSTSERFQKRATDYDLTKLLKLTETFESGYDLISFEDEKSVRQFFNILAYQQFNYQHEYSNLIINRQIVIYCKLSSSLLDIQKAFKNRTGLDILDFFHYCHITYIYLNFEELGNGKPYNGKLNADLFDYFKESETHSIEKFNAFLKLLTIYDFNEFNNLHKLKKEILQLYETNFLVTKPFIFYKDSYRVPHRLVFVQTISFFIYNYMKKNCSLFPEAFAELLEKYVTLGLAECNLPYRSEKDLKKEYALTKVADFLIGSDILLEVKATELQPYSGVSRTFVILERELNTSIIKAYKQLLSTANSIDSGRQWYGIIITYKEMYLGFGLDAWKEFMKAPIEEFLLANRMDIEVLPPGNLFIISISEYDWIIQALKDKKAPSLHAILKKAKECNLNKDPVEAAFMMEQVLRKYFNIEQFTLSYHQEANKILNLFPPEG
jgi:hypothetical protein